MSESLGLNRAAGSEWAVDTRHRKPEPEQSERVPVPEEFQRQRLVPCPDCRKDISSKAESRPYCGRFIQDLHHQNAITLLPGKGWSLAVGWGILLSYLLAALIGAILMFVLYGFLSELGTRP